MKKVNPILWPPFWTYLGGIFLVFAGLWFLPDRVNLAALLISAGTLLTVGTMLALNAD